MQKSAISYVFLTFVLTSVLQADGVNDEKDIYSTVPLIKEKGFTGKVTRNRVRLRLQPSIDSPVLREMDKGEMLVVLEEVDDFYAVKPPSETKAYLYRTYVLDGVVEGNKVNVRLEPHLEAPVIAQMHTGDRVEGSISDQNTKWLEIQPPSSTRFYIASDFVERVGDVHYLMQHEEKKKAVKEQFEMASKLSEQELQKQITDMQPDAVVESFNKILHEFKEFPQEVEKAKKSLAKFNETHLRKKIAYLEAKTKIAKEKEPVQVKQNLTLIEQKKPPLSLSKIYENWVCQQSSTTITTHMALWIPVEIAHYETWVKNHPERPIQEFYQEQKSGAVALKGIIRAYDRPVFNKPGDFILVNKSSGLPIAYLYSTHIDLQEKIGQEVLVEGLMRPNNHFAYPAYFVVDTN